jgi:hypothetical protein
VTLKTYLGKEMELEKKAVRLLAPSHRGSDDRGTIAIFACGPTVPVLNPLSAHGLTITIILLFSATPVPRIILKNTRDSSLLESPCTVRLRSRVDVNQAREAYCLMKP